MKKKVKPITIIVFSVLILAAAIFGSSPIGRRTVDHVKSGFALAKEGLDGIGDFFGEHIRSDEEKSHAVTTDGDVPLLPYTDSRVHTEILASPYNSASKAETVASVGDTDIIDAGGDEIRDSEKVGYTVIPVFASRDAGDVSSVLTAHGIKVEVVVRTNTAPAGEVFAMRYKGKSDGNGFYIDSSTRVTLYVSGTKKAQNVSGGDNTVYLTFDDGPNEKHTEKILDILDTYGVNGAFFTIGSGVTNYPGLAREIVERGHNLGCHTTTHVYSKIYSSVGALEAEVLEWEKCVADAGIELPEKKLFRFPGGSVGTYLDAYKVGLMTEMLSGYGYKAYDWNASANDAVLFLAPDEMTNYDYIKQSFTQSLENCVKQNEGKAGEPIIILMHETSDETPELLTWMIEYLVEHGFSFGNIMSLDGWMFGQ